MTQDRPGIVTRIRSWIAGVLFLTAGRLDSNYDVWLDTAEPRKR
jgi:hypothetical protein